ncbi:hypothetical protein [Novosphingobium sp.]|uniref:hypothetical protein n=1 Tax=Novosphingobium sp. TaxID=1874826 RepID=UPI0038BC8C20
MANNLHISYDLINPGQNYDKVIERVKAMGIWAKVHASFWYVNSSYSARQAADYIAGAMDANDKVYVVDATNNVAAWNYLPKDVGGHIVDQWTK